MTSQMIESSIQRRIDFDPWLEGYESRRRFQPPTRNPYHPETDARTLWSNGWNEADEECPFLLFAPNTQFTAQAG